MIVGSGSIGCKALLRHKTPSASKGTGRSSKSRLDSKHPDSMTQTTANRSYFAQVLCVLCVALVFTMGTVQAVHSHPAKSQTAHHSCSICSAPSLGPTATTVSVLPMVKPVAMAHFTSESQGIFRPVLTNFVRPPPAV